MLSHKKVKPSPPAYDGLPTQRNRASCVGKAFKATRFKNRLDKEPTENKKTGGILAFQIKLVIVDPLSVLGD